MLLSIGHATGGRGCMPYLHALPACLATGGRGGAVDTWLQTFVSSSPCLKSGMQAGTQYSSSLSSFRAVFQVCPSFLVRTHCVHLAACVEDKLDVVLADSGLALASVMTI